jgi:hypothetical protein
MSRAKPHQKATRTNTLRISDSALIELLTGTTTKLHHEVDSSELPAPATRVSPISTTKWTSAPHSIGSLSRLCCCASPTLDCILSLMYLTTSLIESETHYALIWRTVDSCISRCTWYGVDNTRRLRKCSMLLEVDETPISTLLLKRERYKSQYPQVM